VIGSILREVAGWLLVALGLYVFLLSYQMLRDGWILSAPPLVVIGFFVFRGGIHVLKVSIAARISYRAHRELTEVPRRAIRKK
jgi:hypothetical protein